MTPRRTGPDPEESADDVESAGRYILSGPPRVLAALAPVLERDPTATVIAVSREAGEPNRIVVDTTVRRAAALRAALGSAVLVEADQPITPI